MEIKRTPTNIHLDELKSVCSWLSLKQGRVKEYIKFVDEFIQGSRRRENLLSINESFEAIEIYKLWKDRIHEFQGLDEKIKKALLKGPILQEDELVNSSSNEARNNAFTYYISGLLLFRGLDVVLVDGCPRQGADSLDDDILLNIDRTTITIECKRPQSRENILKRAKEAVKKINKRKGIVAIDCSSIIRPDDKLYESDSELEAVTNAGDLIETCNTRQVQSLMQDNILGLIMFARLPTMTRIKHEIILDHLGRPITYSFRPGSVCATNICSSKSQKDNPILNDIYTALKFPNVEGLK